MRNAQAQVELSLMYAQGRGVVEDDTEAAKWLHKAAAQGNEKALAILDAANGSNVTKNK